MTPPSLVKMYSRRRCELCDAARAVIHSERDRDPGRFRFEETFIDDDDELEREYGLRVPVVEIDGVEQFEYSVDPSRFRLLLVP